MRKILLVALALGATPAMAQEAAESTEAKLGGLRIEAHAGIERPNLNTEVAGTTYVDTLGSSFVYGGEIGFDIPVSSTVTVGPYVSFDTGGSSDCETYSAGPGFTGSACFESKSDLSIGARAGFKVGEKAELYIGLGYDMYKVNFSDVVVNSTTSAVVSSFSVDDTRNGIGISFGGNYNLSKNLYVGLGMRVTEAGEIEGTDIGLQRFQGHAAIGLRF